MRHGRGWARRAAGVCVVLLAARGLAAAQENPVRLTGVVYSEFRALLSDTATHRNEFEVTRAYLNVLGKFDHGIATRVTADIYRNPDGSLGYRLKYAYFAWTPANSPATLKFGAIHTPWLDWEEAFWGYRMQGSMATDRAGYLTSADLGAGVDLRASDERVNAQFTVVNGEGYAHPAGGRYRDFEARGSVRLSTSDDMSRVGGLRLSGYGHAGKRSDGGVRDRWLGMLSWRSTRATLAGEFAVTRDGNTNRNLDDIDGRVFSLMGVLNVPGSPWSVIARVDGVDPNTAVDDNAYTRFMGGVSYKLGSNVRVLGDLEHTGYQGTPSAALSAARNRLLFQTEFVF